MSRVIALGQPAAGDDGVGLAVLRALRTRTLPPGTELMQAHDAVALMPLLETPVPVVVVDAAVGETPGEVLALSADALPATALRPVSSHALSLTAAIALTQALSAGRVSPSIQVVAVVIAPPERWSEGLSPGIAAAVPEAADRVLQLLQGAPHA